MLTTIQRKQTFHFVCDQRRIYKDEEDEPSLPAQPNNRLVSRLRNPESATNDIRKVLEMRLCIFGKIHPNI